MFPLLAALLALSPAPQPVVATTAPIQVAPVAPAESPAVSSVLPQAPRDVKVKLTSEGNVITWRGPARKAAAELTGFVVIVDEQPRFVDASTRRAVVPASARQLGVAAMNGAGCSLATWSPDVPAAEPAVVAVASR